MRVPGASQRFACARQDWRCCRRGNSTSPSQAESEGRISETTNAVQSRLFSILERLGYAIISRSVWEAPRKRGFRSFPSFLGACLSLSLSLPPSYATLAFPALLSSGSHHHLIYLANYNSPVDRTRVWSRDSETTRSNTKSHWVHELT